MAAVGPVGVLGAVAGPVGILGAVVAGDLDLLSKVAVGPGPSYGSFGSCCWLNILIMSCDMPIGLFGAEELDGVADLADGCGPVRALEEVLGAVADDELAVEDADLADVCGPVRALAEALGAV